MKPWRTTASALPCRLMVPQLPPQRPGWPSQSSRGGPTWRVCFVVESALASMKFHKPWGKKPKPRFIVGKNHHHISSLKQPFVNLHGCHCHCGFLLFRPFTLFMHQKPSVPESIQAAVERCFLQDSRQKIG